MKKLLEQTTSQIGFGVCFVRGCDRKATRGLHMSREATSPCHMSVPGFYLCDRHRIELVEELCAKEPGPTPGSKFNHMFTVAFSLDSVHEDPEKVPMVDMLRAMTSRAMDLRRDPAGREAFQCNETYAWEGK